MFPYHSDKKRIGNDKLTQHIPSIPHSIFLGRGKPWWGGSLGKTWERKKGRYILELLKLQSVSVWWHSIYIYIGYHIWLWRISSAVNVPHTSNSAGQWRGGGTSLNVKCAMRVLTLAASRDALVSLTDTAHQQTWYFPGTNSAFPGILV